MTDLEIQEKNRKWSGCHGCNVMCSACPCVLNRYPTSRTSVSENLMSKKHHRSYKRRHAGIDDCVLRAYRLVPNTPSLTPYLQDREQRLFDQFTASSSAPCNLLLLSSRRRKQQIDPL